MRIISILLLIFATVLSGCGNSMKLTKQQLSDAEISQIDNGTLIKPHHVLTANHGKISIHKADKLFVCVTDSEDSSGSCFENIGKVITPYFRNAGYDTTNNKADATAIINVGLNFDFGPTRDVDRKLMSKVDFALGNAKEIDHIGFVDALPPEDHSKLNAGIGAGIAALLLGATGQHASFAAVNGASNTLGGSSNDQEMSIQLSQGNSTYVVKLHYCGPASRDKVFASLFDDAMHDVINKM